MLAHNSLETANEGGYEVEVEPGRVVSAFVEHFDRTSE